VYSAQYGRAAGGVINSVTKSGTNQIHGQAYFFDRQSNWAAYNNWTKVSSLVNGQTVTNTIKPKDLRKVYGFTVGGALIKDKLFWIYTFDKHDRIFPVVGVPKNPQQFYTLPQAALSTGETCNTATGALSGAPSAAVNDINACALAARQKISYTQAAYDWAVMTYGNSSVNQSNYSGVTAMTDPGLNSAIGQVPRAGYQMINTPKIDWQINEKNRASFLLHRLRWDSPGGVQTAPSDNYSTDAQGNDFVKLDYGVAKLTTLVTTNISNEVLYQYSRELNYQGQQKLTDFTKANLISGTNVSYMTAGYYNGFNVGSPYYSYRAAYPDERKWQVSDILYWNKGNHSLRAGVDMVHNFDLMNNTYQSNGFFNYNYIGNVFNDLLNYKHGVVPTAANQIGCDSGGSQNYSTKPINGIYPCYYQFQQGFGSPVYTIATLDTGFFVQDNWKFSPRLTLQLGLRWDYQTLPGADPKLTVAAGSFVPYAGLTNNPSDKKSFGPRVGFSYNVFGDSKTVLRGGFGMYYGRITNGNLENVRLNTGSPNGQFGVTWNASTAGAPFPPTVMSSGSSSAKPNSYFLDPNLRMPQVQEYDLVLQQDLTKGNVFALRYLGALGRHLPNFLNLNLNPTTTLTTITIAGDPNGKGPLGATGTQYKVPVYTSYGNTALFGSVANNFQAITEMTSNVNSSYNALVAEVLNRTVKNLQFDVNYTWSHALDYSQNALTQGGSNSWYDPYTSPRLNYGNSNFNVPQRFVAYALYRLPGVNNANPLKWVANGWSINDSFQMQNGLPFTAGSSSSPSGAITSGWNGSGGGSLIPQIGVNTYKYPRRIVDDLRVQKEFALREGKSVELMANFFNVANHQNITGFQATYLYVLSNSAGVTSATYTGTDGTGAKSFMVPNNSNSSAFLYTPRQIEISARLNF
jgi:hypothetical protein